MKKIVLLCLTYFIAIHLVSQDDQQFEFDHFIKSKAFEDERKITVYLPPAYYRSPDQKYTVTYVLDGQHDPFIDLGVKTIEYGTYNNKYTPTIVVGIHAKQRGWEFSDPSLDEELDYDYEGGRAPELQQHFRNEVFPLIDSLYNRTLPFRTLIGHSSGGKFVLYTLFSNEKDLFDAYVGISPGLRPGENRVLQAAAERLVSGEVFNKFLYCSAGTVGEREEVFGGAVERLDSLLLAHPKHGLIWRSSTFEGTGHWTCVSPSFSTAMVELTRAFRVDEHTFHAFADTETMSMTEQIESFYNDIEEGYGFKEVPSAGYINQIAWELSKKNRFQAALEIYDWSFGYYPNNYQLSKSKAKVLVKMGNKKAAHKTFSRCMEVLDIVKGERDKEWYVRQKEYLEERLKENAE